jgi:hypothetical protein
VLSTASIIGFFHPHLQVTEGLLNLVHQGLNISNNMLLLGQLKLAFSCAWGSCPPRPSPLTSFGLLETFPCKTMPSSAKIELDKSSETGLRFV